MEYITIKNKCTEVILDTTSLLAEIRCAGRVWLQNKAFAPAFSTRREKELVDTLFSSAGHIEHALDRSGPYNGIRSTFSGFGVEGKDPGLSFQTFIWLDEKSPEVHFDFIPLVENDDAMTRVKWPAPIDMGTDPAGYAAIPIMQGQLIYNSDPVEVKNFMCGKIFDRGCIMPWFGQTLPDGGMMCVYDTPWDAENHFRHEAGTRTDVWPAWVQSQGRIRYKRECVYKFFGEGCDYVTFAKEYRKIAVQKGEIRTLAEKALQDPRVDELFGNPIVHTSPPVLWHCEPTSIYFNKEDPEKNHVFRSFASIADNLEALHAAGVEKAYVHIDGWGKRGYDNLHPDILPPCEEAGGTEGMADMLRRIRALGYIPAVHDQFRDYYVDGESYDKKYACSDPAGNIRYIHVWPGGTQNILCARVALEHVKKNYAEMAATGILPDGSYLDTFAAVNLDECNHPEHAMTRKECMEKRAECLEFIRSLGLIVSSEEPIGCFVRNMDMVHHGPWYYAIWGEDRGATFGVSVPLFNLVYHDCLILPWTTGMGGWGIKSDESAMLHALLNGGMPYLTETSSAAEIERVRPILRLHARVGRLRMERHGFIEGDPRRQFTEFSDGTRVEADFDKLTFTVKYPEGITENGACNYEN